MTNSVIEQVEQKLTDKLVILLGGVKGKKTKQQYLRNRRVTKELEKLFLEYRKVTPKIRETEK